MSPCAVVPLLPIEGTGVALNPANHRQELSQLISVNKHYSDRVDISSPSKCNIVYIRKLAECVNNPQNDVD